MDTTERLHFHFSFHALEKEMATHSSVLAWRTPGTRGAWWAAVYGVTQSQTRLKRLSSSSSILIIGEGNGNPLQCSCLENPRDGGAWWAAISGVAQGRTRQKRLSSSGSSSSILIRNHNKGGTPQLWGNVREKIARVSFEEK